MELLLGCGSNKSRQLRCIKTGSYQFKDLVTLDNNRFHKPDILCDLNIHPLPMFDNIYDEIHAYEVLEHLAQQGDYRFFFREFTEYHRILKPGGLFYASVPDYRSQWAWGDPSHTRVITAGTLAFLSQEQYEKQVGKTPMSDFRYIYKADFKLLYSRVQDERFYFILEAIK